MDTDTLGPDEVWHQVVSLSSRWSRCSAAGAAIWRSIREPSALVLPLTLGETLRPRPVRVSGLASSVGYSGKLHLAPSLPRPGQKHSPYSLLQGSSLIAEMRDARGGGVGLSD